MVNSKPRKELNTQRFLVESQSPTQAAPKNIQKTT
jgi:hypothetical protein